MTDYLRGTIEKLRQDIDAAFAAGNRFELTQLELLIRQYEKTLEAWEGLQAQLVPQDVAADAERYIKSL